MNIAKICLIAGCASAVAACAKPQDGASSPSPGQVKQQELEQMEAQGQRNDIDKPFKK